MAKRQAKVIGEVSIYGTSEAGHGYLTRLADGRRFGTGEPVAMRSATDTLWVALNEFAGVGQVVPGRSRALVLVHYDFPSGPKVATLKAAEAWPYWGDLKWEAGPVYEISAEAIRKASQEGQ